MKVIKEKGANSKERTVTLRIPETTMENVDRIAKANKLSRQKLIAAILEQVMNDRSFELRIKNI